MTLIALITGANKGLGFEVARQLAQQVIHILVGARDPEKGNAAEQLPLDVLVKIYETNVFGAFLAIREFLPLLRKSTQGRIVNASSTVGSIADRSNLESMEYGVRTIG